MKTSLFNLRRGGGVLILLLASIVVVSCHYDMKGVEILASDYGMETDEDGFWLVSTSQNLVDWNTAAQLDKTISVRLESDIDMTGQTWTPVGTDEDKYTGTFDGSGYTISNLTISSEDSYVGMFGFIGLEGTVKNLVLDSASVTGYDYAGSIAGVNKGTIENCSSINGKVEGNKYVGGIVGYNNAGSTSEDEGGIGTITACYFTGTVTGYEYVGGIAGWNGGNSYITACYSYATVAGNLTEGNGGVGGITGQNDGTVQACYSTSTDVTGYIRVGLAIGRNGGGYATYCYSLGTTIGEEKTHIDGGSSDYIYTITDTDTDWSQAMSDMNSYLGSTYGYKYEVNSESDADNLPLKVVKA